MTSTSAAAPQKFSRYRSVRRAARIVPGSEPPLPPHKPAAYASGSNAKHEADRQQLPQDSLQTVEHHSADRNDFDANLVDAWEHRHDVSTELEHRGRLEGREAHIVEHHTSQQRRVDQDVHGSQLSGTRGRADISRASEVVFGKSMGSYKNRAEADPKEESSSLTEIKKSIKNPFSYFSKKRSVSRSVSRSISRSQSPIRETTRQTSTHALQAAPPQPEYDLNTHTVPELRPSGRMASVRYGDATVSSVVAAESTTVDLIRDAAKKLSVDISPANTVASEYYVKLGLRRAIRPSEKVQNVIRSWGHETRNYIELQRFDAGDIHMQTPYLIAEPLPVTTSMYHSQEPGRWNKKAITLKDGQIQVTTKHDAVSHEFSDLCHVSDFDIYTIESTYLQTTLKPPRKYCYAIKSQQKLSAFHNDTTYFVHFFCSGDKTIAEEWYKAVQKSRSWYLQRNDQSSLAKSYSPDRKTTTSTLPDRSRSIRKPSAPVRQSDLDKKDEESTFKNAQAASVDSSDDENRPRQIPLHLRLTPGDTPPPYEQAITMSSSTSKHLQSRAQEHQYKANTPLSTTSNKAPFTATGLLGDSYPQRQGLVHQNVQPPLNDAPFSDGKGLLGAAYPQKPSGVEERPGTSGGKSFVPNAFLEDTRPTRRATVRSKRPEKSDIDARLGSSSSNGHQGSMSRPPTSDSVQNRSDPGKPDRSVSVTRPRTTSSNMTGLKRNTSIARREDPQRPPGLPAPLLDFEEPSNFVEAPQWRNRTTGRGVEAPAGVRLIDVASNPDVPGVEMPKPGVFRRPS